MPFHSLSRNTFRTVCFAGISYFACFQATIFVAFSSNIWVVEMTRKWIKMVLKSRLRLINSASEATVQPKLFRLCDTIEACKTSLLWSKIDHSLFTTITVCISTEWRKTSLGNCKMPFVRNDWLKRSKTPKTKQILECYLSRAWVELGNNVNVRKQPSNTLSSLPPSSQNLQKGLIFIVKWQL